MKPIWYYMDNKRVTSSHLLLRGTRTALCGRNPESYGISWKGDEKGLEGKTRCKICLRILG